MREGEAVAGVGGSSAPQPVSKKRAELSAAPLRRCLRRRREGMAKLVLYRVYAVMF